MKLQLDYSSIQKELQKQVENYKTAFKADKVFHELKTIRNAINILKERLDKHKGSKLNTNKVL